MNQDIVDSDAAAQSAVERLATELGLQIERATRQRAPYRGVSFHLSGSLRGVPLTARISHHDYGGVFEMAGECHVALTPELWTDVELIGRPFPSFFRRDPLSPELTAEFDVRVSDLMWLTQLLDPPLERLLIDINQAGLSPRLNAWRVSLSTDHLGTPSNARRMLQHISTLVERLETRRRAVDEPLELRATADAWQWAASQRDGTFERDALTMRLEALEGHLTLQTVHSGYDDWETRVGFERKRPLSVKLRVSAVRNPWALWFRPDIKTGDAPFDRAFAVQGEPTPDVAALLSEPLRKDLAELRASFDELLVTERALQATTPRRVSDPEEARRIVDAVVRISEELSRSRGGARAYR